MWACYFHRRAIDAAFVGTLPAERWPSLRAHVEGCAACREHYEKLGAVGRALGPGGAAPLMRETLGEVVVSEGTGRRRRVPWMAGIGLAVAAAAAFLLFLRPRPADDLRPRGGPTSPGRPPGVRLLCVADGRVLGEVVATATAGEPLRCPRTALLQLVYSSAPAQPLALVVYGERDGARHWYAPRQPDAAPVAVTGDELDRPLDWSTRLAVNHTPGTVDVVVRFVTPGPATADEAARAPAFLQLAARLEVE